ncbi:MAG: acyl carrier protein [Candidatus Brocadiia bacterium]
MLDESAIKEELVAQFAAILGIDQEEVRNSESLESLGMDSIRLVEVFIFIEKKYGVQLMEAGVTEEDFRDVDSLAGCVARLAAGGEENTE